MSNENIDASGHDELVKLQIVGIDFSVVGACDVVVGDVWACDDLVGDVWACDDVFDNVWAFDDFVDDVRAFDDVCDLVVDVAINGSDGCAALIDHRVALINWEKYIQTILLLAITGSGFDRWLDFIKKINNILNLIEEEIKVIDQLLVEKMGCLQFKEAIFFC